MNKQRRQELLDVASMLEDAIDLLCEVQNDEQEAFDNMPEGLQESDRGWAMQDAIDIMDDWHSQIETIKGAIEDFALPTTSKTKKSSKFVI